jgi:hypothetical protein
MYNLPDIAEPVETLERLVRKEKDAEIQQWLAKKHGIELPYSTAYGIVRYEIGAKPKAP